MKTNAYMLSRTMRDYDSLLAKLTENEFEFQKEDDGTSDVRIYVPFERSEKFADLVQPYIIKPYDYVDIKYPEHNQILAIFGGKRFKITNLEENKVAQKWAIDLGLPVEQADWSHWFK